MPAKPQSKTKPLKIQRLQIKTNKPKPGAPKRGGGRKTIGAGHARTHNVTMDDTAWAALQVKAQTYTGNADSVSELCRAIASKAELRPDGSLYLPGRTQ